MAAAIEVSTVPGAGWIKVTETAGYRFVSPDQADRLAADLIKAAREVRSAGVVNGQRASVVKAPQPSSEPSVPNAAAGYWTSKAENVPAADTPAAKPAVREPAEHAPAEVYGGLSMEEPKPRMGMSR